MADSCVSALAWMQKRGLAHTQINTKRIFCVIDKYKLFPVNAMINSLRDRPNRDRSQAYKEDAY